MKPIVFLHIPKTAGQTVHHAIAAMVGGQNTSPVRVNEQAKPYSTSFPDGFLFHSGHLDWGDLDRVPNDPFVFTVLRDPLERIGSFYFYMRKKAEAAPKEEVARRVGLQNMLSLSVDDYFFSGDAKWQRFVRNMYFNFYASYFATKLVSGRRLLKDETPAEIVSKAAENAKLLTRIYHIEALDRLEADIKELYGQSIVVASKHTNEGGHQQGESRWDKLCASLERDASVRLLEGFATEDFELMEKLKGLDNHQCG